MKRATALPAYRNTQAFEPPPGVITALIDPETLQLATPVCPAPREEVFIEGTEPKEFCARHGGRSLAQSAEGGSWLSRIFGGKKKEAEPEPEADAAATPQPGDAKAGASSATGRPDARPRTARPGAKTAANGAPQQTAPAQEHKSIWQRLFGIFGGGKKDTSQPPAGAPAKKKDEKPKAPPQPSKPGSGGGEGKSP
jgi:hypothetical protein